jgi:hypothetical protein
MWQRRMTQHSLVTTGLTITSQYRSETWKSRSNRSMSLKGEKSSIVVLWVEGSYYTMKRGSSQTIGAATTQS